VPQKLTPRQARFVEEYLIDLNATKAAERAGFSAKTVHVQGPRLLANVRVAEAIAAAKEKRLARVEITQDRVLRELAALAFSNLTHFEVDDFGKITLAPDAPTNAHAAVSSIKHRITRDEDGNTTREVEIKLWDKPSMVKIAGRHTNTPGFWDRMEVSGPDGKPIEIQEQRAAVNSKMEALFRVAAAKRAEIEPGPKPGE
jgi:phage terminase small subunit